MAEKKNKTKSINIKNKRASFDFLLLDKYTGGQGQSGGYFLFHP